LCRNLGNPCTKNTKIKGINILEKEKKITLLADDTSLILDGSEQSLNASMDVLKYFANILGFHINYNKTQVIWIGNMKYSEKILHTDDSLEWGKERFKLLGINFDVDLQEIFELNFKQKFAKLKNTMKNWNRRYLTPLGRITVLKTLLLSQLNHIFASLPNPSDTQLKEMDDSFFFVCYG
jgi:hypothetical protein